MTPAERDEVRNAALEEAAEAVKARAESLDGREVDAMSTISVPDAMEAILRLMSPPHEVLCEHGAGEGVECYVCHPPAREMASEANGLLPKSRRKEHDYGPEKKGVRGILNAYCTRPGCTAFYSRHHSEEMRLFHSANTNSAIRTESSCRGT